MEISLGLRRPVRRRAREPPRKRPCGEDGAEPGQREACVAPGLRETDVRIVVKTHIMRATLSARGTEGLVTAFPGRSPSEVTVISALGFPKYLLSRGVKATLPLRWFEVAVQGSRTPELGSPGRWCQGPSRRGHRARVTAPCQCPRRGLWRRLSPHALPHSELQRALIPEQSMSPGRPRGNFSA